MPLHCRRHTDFRELRAAWSELEARGGCSSLFSCWEWQANWWRVWGRGRELHLYSVCDERGTVVGIAPLYLRTYRFRKILRLRQLQWIGNVYGTDETVLSEYADVIAADGDRVAVAAALWQHLKSEDWDECVIAMIRAQGALLRAPIAGFSAYSRAEGPGVRIGVSGRFSDYLATLSKHMRLRLFNRRAVLNALGTVEHLYADATNIAEFLDRLNQLDRLRWGRDCFAEKSLDFHCAVAAAHAASGALRLSALKVNGETVSILYNIRFDGIEYNIQSAFVPDFHPKLSLGTLHLGFAIESAFGDSETRYFDLLFGNGKNEFYKRHYRGEEIDFFTLIASRSRKAKLKNRLLRWRENP